MARVVAPWCPQARRKETCACHCVCLSIAGSCTLWQGSLLVPTRQCHGDTNRAQRHKRPREQCLGNLFKRGGRREYRVAEVDGHTAGCTTLCDVHRQKGGNGDDSGGHNAAAKFHRAAGDHHTEHACYSCQRFPLTLVSKVFLATKVESPVHLWQRQGFPCTPRQRAVC